MQTARKVEVADSRWRSFPLRGSLPFSGANAALGYLPLQLALRFEGRKLKDPSGERPILRTMKGEHAFRPGEGPFYGHDHKFLVILVGEDRLKAGIAHQIDILRLISFKPKEPGG